MAIQTVIVMDPVQCSVCGLTFGLPQAYVTSLRETGQGFTCPNGHTLTYGKSTADRLRTETAQALRMVDQLAASLTATEDQLKATAKSLAAQKDQASRLRQRVGVGVCPSCHRSFPALRKHMADQHPEFREEFVQFEDGSQHGRTAWVPPR